MIIPLFWFLSFMYIIGFLREKELHNKFLLDFLKWLEIQLQTIELIQSGSGVYLLDLL